MRKALSIAGLCAATLIVSPMAAATMDFRTCKFKVMHDARYKSRNICGAQCAAAIKRCMASNGKVE